MSNITFSTCLYNFKSKFDISVYKQWMHNMLSNVNNYNLVVYTDEDGLPMFEPYLKPNIKIIVKPYSEFYTYQFKDSWIKNQERNTLLLNKIDWKVNMLWSEKINFVNETIQQKYFVTEFYGWCDIGYFRGRNVDLDTNSLKLWPSQDAINLLPKDKIQYGCVNNSAYLHFLHTIINNKNEFGLPIDPIPPEQVSLAGGFFILHVSRASWWHDTYYNKLKLYFDNDYLVKDDQIIIADCVFSNIKSFALRVEPNSQYDRWFMFQRLLL